jgi:hypothetical protein
VKTGLPTTGPHTAAPSDGADEGDREAAIARLHDLFSTGELPFERFCRVLDQLFSAPSHAELEVVMSALPPPVRITPPWRRLDGPLVLRVAGSGLELGSGWQLAADTTVCTGIGTAQLDLTIATWDSPRVHLRLETWGSIEVLVPEGVVVQVAGGSGRVSLESLSPPVPGAPVLRISQSGPAGVIRVLHRGRCGNRRSTLWRRHAVGSPIPGPLAAREPSR